MAEREGGPYTSEDYWNLPEGHRAELIDGVLYDSAAPGFAHQRLVAELYYALRSYIGSKGGECKVLFAPYAVNLFADDSTWVEPDVLVVCDPSKLSQRACEGAPDLVIEVVSPSSRRMDYIKKLSLYEQAGVREYWIVDPDAAQTAVYRFGEGRTVLSTHPFAEPVCVGLWDDLSITLEGLA